MLEYKKTMTFIKKIIDASSYFTSVSTNAATKLTWVAYHFKYDESTAVDIFFLFFTDILINVSKCLYFDLLFCQVGSYIRLLSIINFHYFVCM